LKIFNIVKNGIFGSLFWWVFGKKGYLGAENALWTLLNRRIWAKLGWFCVIFWVLLNAFWSLLSTFEHFLTLFGAFISRLNNS